MTRQRVINVLFASAIAVVACAPLVQMVAPLVPADRIEERRGLHDVPSFVSRLVRLDPALAYDVSRWFDDRYGFRDLLIRTKNEFDYRVFGVSEKVWIGGDGFLFDKSVMKVTDDNNKEHGLAERALANIRALRDCLASRQVKLVVVLSPDKRSIYPEELPPFAPKRGHGAVQQMADALESEPGIIFINGETLLRAHKTEPVFLRTDLHTSMRGGALIYHTMLDKIAAAYEREPPPVRELRYATGSYADGGEARFLAKLTSTTEVVEGPANPASPGDTKDDGVWRTDVGQGGITKFPDLPAFDDVYQNHRKTELLPPVVVFGSSFSGFMFPAGIAEAFEAAYRVKNNEGERIIPTLKSMPKDVGVFVFEFPEFMLQMPAKFPVRMACEEMPTRSMAPRGP